MSFYVGESYQQTINESATAVLHNLITRFWALGGNKWNSKKFNPLDGAIYGAKLAVDPIGAIAGAIVRLVIKNGGSPIDWADWKYFNHYYKITPPVEKKNN